jgi:hypothetical protein
MYKLTILIIISLLAIEASSQRSSRWKRMRYEVYYGTGATNFLGELGGANREGTNFVRDLEFSMTRPMLQLGIRYRILEALSTKVMFTYGWLRGDDQLTMEQYRSNRNLHFRSPIFEFSGQLEYSIIKEKQGHRYNLRRVRGIKGFKTNTYFFVGVGGLYFNPRAKLDGKWYSLQPLGTEGQGLVPTRKPYSRFTVCIPYGIGFKYGMNRRWNIGLELGVRKTFSDYLDDVSTTYYDNTLIRNAKGDVAAYLADPSDGTHPNWTAAYQQRGDAKDKDSYMLLSINLTYKLHTNRQGLPKFR